MLCPACSSVVPDGSRFCGSCGSALGDDGAATQTSVGSGAASGGTPTSAPSLDESRFLPGTIVDGRYRIVGLLGRGGMGEVYRADDLKLGQPVALKFLPAELARDDDRRNRFLNEVKIARQVAHPNVCRVYDVGESDGHHYLSMEYVDGEDLATLLRRIGRLPEDKAVQIARQLCAGLAAAHELGILHRDIKPSNVMLDGRGRAKLTDFGLAGLARDFQGAELRVGTPVYMAPEQIAGKEVSVRSDVYSLGLVLYELFTGKRAIDAGSLLEIKQKHLETVPTSPSSFMPSFDPVVERVLLQCLEKDPSRRPPSALAVAAALPGGDPLAAALAAGETPSPEMIAAAGPQGGMRPGVATACLVGVVAIWLVSWFPTRTYSPLEHAPMKKSYLALKENAREIAARLGYEDDPRMTWAGFGLDIEEFLYVTRTEGPGAVVAAVREPGQPIYWMDYRQRRSPILPLALNGRVSWNSPPPGSGEVAMEVDLRGRLSVLRVTPRRIGSRASSDDVAEESPPAAESTADWGLVFELAGLDIAEFTPTEPTVLPLTFADDRRAWTGMLADYADREVRVEAASLAGRPVFFHKIIPSDSLWTGASGQPQPEIGFGLLVAMLIVLLILLSVVIGGALFLAVRNLRLGRGDRTGAFRVAAFVFAMRTLHWAFAGDHVGHPVEIIAFAIAMCGATTLAVLAWVLYVACEPYARRLSPESLVAWTRVLGARFRDPLVGRDVLIGCTFGAATVLVSAITLWIGTRLHVVGVVPLQQLSALRGGRYAVGELFAAALMSMAVALVLMMLFLLLRLILRKTSIASIAFCLVLGLFSALNFAGLFGAAGAGIGFVLQIVSAVVLILVLLRFGLLALAAFILFTNLWNLSLFTFDTAAPHFGIGLFVTAVAFALAAWGWKTSLAGRVVPIGPSAS